MIVLAFAVMSSPARADDKPAAQTATSTIGMSAEDLELARWLDVLEHLEVLEDFEYFELLPLLEDDDER
jgi:hypothetical protein